MKIEEAQVQLSATHHEVEHHERSEQLRMWKDGEGSLEYANEEHSTTLRAEAEQLGRLPTGAPPPLDGLPEQARPDHPPGLDWADISPTAAAMQAAEASEMKEVDDELELEVLDDLKLSMVKLMIEAFTGREIEIYRPGKEGEGSGESALAPPKSGPPAEGAPTEGEREGWGMVYDYHEFHLEEEQTRFQAHGVVRTEDGREIDFTAELEMSRHFASREQLSLRAGDALKDPLVLNFNGTAAQLTEERMAFDIDGDGEKDEIALLAPNSAYLALDRDGDGRINDGTELFGPESGDGFEELSRLDEDGNRWIDENDSSFDKLLLWSPAGEGADSLRTLTESNVGAIYLGRVNTQFSLKDSSNELQGEVRTSSVYLNEDGTPGTIQQLDLVA